MKSDDSADEREPSVLAWAIVEPLERNAEQDTCTFFAPWALGRPCGGVLSWGVPDCYQFYR